MIHCIHELFEEIEFYIDKALYIDFYLFFIFDKILFSIFKTSIHMYTSYFMQEHTCSMVLKRENVLDVFFLWGCIWGRSCNENKKNKDFFYSKGGHAFFCYFLFISLLVN